MRDFRDSKAMAVALREALKDKLALSHSESLELVAKQFGYADWNILAARIAAAPQEKDGIAITGHVPILRIFSVERAKEFYLGFLGFKIDWEHRRSPDAPLYAQISRPGLVLHLSEHHGDAAPGSTVLIYVKGLDALHAEVLARNYPYMRPSVQRTDWGARVMSVVDPFGGHLRFCELDSDRDPATLGYTSPDA